MTDGVFRKYVLKGDKNYIYYVVSLLSEKQNANDFYTQKQNLPFVDLD